MFGFNFHRIVTLCMLLPLAFALGYAQHAKHSTEITVFFRVNSSTIDLGYFGNAEALTSLDKTIDMFRMNIDSVSIVAYASPEGDYAYNTALSARRAASMRKFLETRYNDVDFKNIQEVVGGPDFDGLARKIEADTRVPYRKEVLDIVRNWGDNPVATFRKLKALRNGVPYNYIRYHYLPWLRTATTVIFHYNASVSLYKEQNERLTVSGGSSSYVLPQAYDGGAGSAANVSTGAMGASASRARAREESAQNAQAGQGGSVAPCAGTVADGYNPNDPLAGLPVSSVSSGSSTAIAAVPAPSAQGTTANKEQAGAAQTGAAAAAAGQQPGSTSGSTAAASTGSSAAGAGRSASEGQQGIGSSDKAGQQADAKTVTFFVPVNGSEIDTTNAENAAALAALRQALSDGYAAEGGSVLVHAYASPDGSTKGNKMLSDRRAESAVAFLEGVLPESTQVDYVSEGESWDGLRESIEKNYNRPDRDRVLAILSSDKPADQKKQELNKLDPASRKEIVGERSKNLRSVSIRLTKPEQPAEQQPAAESVAAPADTTAVPAQDTVATTAPADTTAAIAAVVAAPADTTAEIAAPVAAAAQSEKATESAEAKEAPAQSEVAPAAIDTTVVIAPAAIDTASAVEVVAGKDDAARKVAADSLAAANAVDTTAAPADTTAKAAREKKPLGTIIAVKTNMLYDLVTALNVEVEIPIANRFSIAAENVFPWWETGNKYCFQLWEMGAEARVWLKAWDARSREKLRGWFAGVYAMSGKFDFQFDKKLNYQGEFWSAGATLGYTTTLGRKEWGNLEFSISDGYLEAPYRHYYPTDDYSKLMRDKSEQGTLYSYFIYPTKAKVSLVIPIPGKKKEARHE